MGSTSIACPKCQGAGHHMVPGTTTTLTATPPPTVKQTCGECSGTGSGRDAKLADLKAYLGAPFPESEKIFALARQVAAVSTRPKAKDVVTSREEVRHGMFGRKSRMEDITREVQQNYWVLGEKRALIKKTGSQCERGASEEEETEFQTRWCLTGDGSFQILARHRECVLFNFSGTYKYEEMAWSGWGAAQISDLAEFSADFDFTGQWREDLPNYFHWDDAVGRIVNRSKHAGSSVRLRQLYTKGEGLTKALLELKG